MIAVASMSPVRITTLRPRRRVALRSPIRRNTGCRAADTDTAATTTASAASRTVASVPAGIPAILLTARRYPRGAVSKAGVSANTTS